jgi:hypothetical protein
MGDLATHDWVDDQLFDSAVVRHGFAPYMRDYDLIVEVPAAKLDGSGSYIEGQYRYRFTHCVEAHVETTLRPDTWQRSWTDEFTRFAVWEQAGTPEGFVWGVEYADAYPGASRIADSPLAEAWSEKLGKRMHQIQIETNAFVIDLVCHDLRVDRRATGDPTTEELTPTEH